MKRKWIRILVFIWILVVAALIGNLVLRSTVEKKVRATLNQFAPFIHIEFSQIHVNLFPGSVRIDSVVIHAHPELQQILQEHTAYFPTVSLTGINLSKIISGKDFAAGSLLFDKGLIRLDRDLLNRHDTLPANALKSVHLAFKNISFGSVIIRNAHVVEFNSKHDDSLLNGNLVLYNVQFDHFDSTFLKKGIHVQNLRCDLNDIVYALPGYHLLTVKKILLNSKDSSLDINSLKIIPQLGKIEFGQKLGHQADRIDAAVSNVRASGLDVLQLVNKKFFAANIEINKSQTSVFRDRRLPREMKEQPTPLGYLEKIPLEVRITQVKINDATIASEEFPQEGAQTGFIRIDHINSNLSPVVNHPRNTDPTVITANVQGSIMGAGNIHATIRLDLSTGTQDIKGMIENLKLPAMNPSAENLGKFHIESGLLDKLDFQFTATNEKASGDIVGLYQNLVINGLKINDINEKKTPEPAGLELHQPNMSKNKDASMPVEERTGKIDYPRDPTRLVTFYLLKALLDGIRDSFGLGFLFPN